MQKIMSEHKLHTAPSVELAQLAIVTRSLTLAIVIYLFGDGAAATFSAMPTDYLYFCVCITFGTFGAFGTFVTFICYTLCNDRTDYIEIGDSVSIKTALG